jgi:hypothetical protein
LKFAWDKGHIPRTVLTAAGDVCLNRLYVACPRCPHRAYPLDQRLGITGFVSPHAKKLLCLAGTSWSFDRAAEYLADFCGLRTCDQTIRAVCQEQAEPLADWLHSNPQAGVAFAAAAGAVEFQTDGTMVNTTAHGWREMRLGIFAKRQPGQPATAQQWDTRRLPPPTTRVLFAAVQAAQQFGPRIRAWATRLGIRDPTAVTVLADGADWIWKQVAVQLPGATGVLDIFHALEHVGACANLIYGEGSAASRRWQDRGRQALLNTGRSGIEALLTASRADGRAVRKREALAALRGYFCRQKEHLGYRQRLESGQSIGSGLVEGSCKQVIGRRLKQTGARWTIRRVNRMATLCCALHGDTWKPYWDAKLN